ncbi:hypothetical protein EJ110_NYTH31596 [Nymphaea thermarum]|nr:hypothetical protein EJ110_NYTH31596 [Nymphaea thermarum]
MQGSWRVQLQGASWCGIEQKKPTHDATPCVIIGSLCSKDDINYLLLQSKKIVQSSIVCSAPIGLVNMISSEGAIKELRCESAC